MSDRGSGGDRIPPSAPASTPDRMPVVALSPLGTARLRFSQLRGDWAHRPPALEVTLPLKANARELDVPPEIVDLAWELVSWQSGLDRPEVAALLDLALAALVSVRQGSTRLPLLDEDGAHYLGELLSLLKGGAEEAEASLRAIIDLLRTERAADIIGRPGDHKPLIIEDDSLYFQRLLRQEDRFVGMMARLLGRRTENRRESEIDAALRDVIARPARTAASAIELSAEQAAAVRGALRSPFTVISGGPGTGKTSITVSMLRVLARLGKTPESIAIAAPTGKAAHRVAAAIQSGLSSIEAPSAEDRSLLDRFPKPQTLHRLLGYSPSVDRFLHHEDNPLSERFVIIDESSMIDLTLMDRLFRSLHLDASLVLLGDAEQLPSVDAGAVLRDITAADAARDGAPKFTLSLQESYRMNASDPAGRNILRVARRVKTGDVEGIFALDAELREPDGAPRARGGREPPRAGARRPANPGGEAGPSGDERIALRRHARDVAFRGIEMLGADGPELWAARQSFLERWHLERSLGQPEIERLASRTYDWSALGFSQASLEDLSLLFEHLERSKILCVTKSAFQPSGSDAVNRALHRMALRDVARSDGGERERGAQDRLGAAGGEPRSERRDRFLPGEPIMVQRNDYDRRLFNGDQGVVLNVSEEESGPLGMAVFRQDNAFTSFHIDAMEEELTLSYAMTVHKSQGSEFDGIALMLPERDVSLVTREVLYTALTRSRRSVVIVGSKGVFERGVVRRIQRYSGLAPKLTRALEALEDYGAKE